MKDATPTTNHSPSNARVIADAGTPGWIAFATVTSSYFVVLVGVLTYCVIVP